MGELPAERITPAHAFLNSGIDYAGPFYIKKKIRLKILIKIYICIFVCYVTKAVHIEVARDASEEAFLKCFKRFIARRGRCKNIYSDNSLNFVGAKTNSTNFMNF